jgi:hypothetical protein
MTCTRVLDLLELEQRTTHVFLGFRIPTKSLTFKFNKTEHTTLVNLYH